jgi:hypothetical protein
MKYLPLLLLSVVLLAACQPSLEEVVGQTADANTAIAINWTKTPTTTPTSTATNIPTNTSTPIPPKITILDTFFYDNVSTSATSKVTLQRGEKYWVILSGTYSHWASQVWTGYRLCWGSSEPQPMFPSPNKTNGPVGSDSYHAFGEPGGPAFPRENCEMREEIHTQAALSAIRISVDGGTSFSYPTPTVQEIRADHTYLYAIIGQGYPLTIKIEDNPRDDNHGQIFVIIEQIN